MKFKKASVDYLPVRALRFDSRYQRQFIPAKVKQLVREWRLESVGVITVSIRDGVAYVIDGQHRVRAAIELGLGDTKVLCVVYRDLAVQQEAQKFLDLNDAKRVTSLDRYKAGLVAHDPVCLGVRDTLDKHGLAVSGSAKADGYLSCVSLVLALYERDPELLDRVCTVLIEAWGTRQAAWQQNIVAGMGKLLGRFDGEVDHGTLSKKLSKYRGGPGALDGDASGLSDFRPINKTTAVAEIVRDIYNRGRREGALSPL